MSYLEHKKKKIVFVDELGQKCLLKEATTTLLRSVR